MKPPVDTGITLHGTVPIGRLLTEPASEYLALTELRRFGIEPYMPQLRRRHRTRPGHYVTRQYPLFPRYLFLHINDASAPAIHMARGISRFRPILADDDGRPWRAPCCVIDAIRLAEGKGDFDQILHKATVSRWRMAYFRLCDRHYRAISTTPIRTTSSSC